ncbi:DUF3788 family protein [candidate division KSB1 bacterium]|nr:DUF3788 family protein [candidate division KSB1 bacterium]
MDSNILFDKTIQPDDDLLRKIYGDSWIHWCEIINHLEKEVGNIHTEWKYYYQKSGWLLQVLRKNKTVFWLRPHIGYFSISFWFGDKGVAIVEKSDFPWQLKNELITAKKYMIGRCITIHMDRLDDVINIKKLIHLKLDKA